MFTEIRSEPPNGKLLFKWDPQKNIVDIVLKNTIYSVKLNNQTSNGEYKIINKRSKDLKN